MATYPEDHPLHGWYRWRGYAWSTDIQGHGGKPSPSAYPNQGLDIETSPYEAWWWLTKARMAALPGYATPRFGTAGYCKYQGDHARTPLGTFVAELTRTGGDYLASSCGYCGLNVTRCLKSGCQSVSGEDV